MTARTKAAGIISGGKLNALEAAGLAVIDAEQWRWALRWCLDHSHDQGGVRKRCAAMLAELTAADGREGG